MLPDVMVSVRDGGLGLLAPTGSGAHAKVGVSSAGTVGEVAAVSDIAKVPELFGTGPLCNALADSFMAGSRLIYAVRATGDIQGTVGTVTKQGTGTGSVSVSGSPLDAYQARIEITRSGRLNSAAFRYSLDGGYTFSGEATVPQTGQYQIPGTGLTLTFTEGVSEPENSFLKGDAYTFETTAPRASVSSVAAALDALLASGVQYEFIHVVGASDAAAWASFASKAASAESAYRYIHILAEAAGPGAGQTVDQWVQGLLDAAASFSSPRVSVCAALVEVSDFLTGRRVQRNGAGIYAGRVSAVPVQRSPGRVMDGPLPGIISLLPAGLNDGHIAALDEARFVTFRQYVGLSGYYVTNGRMMAEVVSDFRYVELRRVMDKACTLVRAAALAFEQAEATPEGLQALEAHLTAPLEAMAGAGEIASGRVVIPRDQDILGTSTLRAKVRIVPVAIMRTIEVEIGFENPYRS